MDNSTRNISNNSTFNSSEQHFSIEGITAFSVVFFITIFLVLVLDVLTSVAVLRAPSLRLPIKALLLNLLVANLLTIVTLLLFLLSILVLAYNQVDNSDAVFCRLVLSGFIIAAVERLFALAAFSAVTLAIVIRGISFITPLRLFFSIAVGWVLAIVINIDVFIPQIFIVTYVDNIACFPNVGAVMHADVKIFIDAVYITFGGIIPLLVCLVIPIVALCYINHKAVSESGDYSKALAKFGLFLVAGNFINLLGQTLPTLIAYDTGPLNVYVAFGFAAISIIPTPILTIIFLKPVREHIHKQLKQCLSCFALHKNEEKIRMKQFTSSNTATDTSQTLNDIVSQEGVDQHSDFTE